MKLSVIAIILAFVVHQAYAQSSKRFTVSGYIKEDESGETLIGVNIYLPDLLIRKFTR